MFSFDGTDPVEGEKPNMEKSLGQCSWVGEGDWISRINGKTGSF